MTDDNDLERYYLLFNEIGLIEQLARSLLEAQLPAGLIAPHFNVLSHLSRVRDGQTPLTLARAFQVPKTTMTHTLAGLERRGLVDLRPNPEDARSKCVWLTEDGRAMLARTIDALGPELRDVATRFPPAQLDAVLPVLRALREHLDAARNG